MATCSVPVCDRPVVSKGFCGGHYQRFRKGLPLDTPLRSKKRRGREDRICEECGQTFSFDTRSNNAGRFCSRPCFTRRRGERHHNYRGGHDDGKYRFVYADRADGKRKLVSEHRLVMERIIGRELHPWETVHHKDDDGKNNAKSNLELWSSRHPKGRRVEDLVTFAREILELYGDLT